MWRKPHWERDGFTDFENKTLIFCTRGVRKQPERLNIAEIEKYFEHMKQT